MPSAVSLLGFRPLTSAEPASTHEATKTIKTYFKRRRDRIYEKIKHANYVKIITNIIKTDVVEYNQRIAKYKGLIPFIEKDEIAEIIKKSTGKPNKLGLQLQY